MSYKNITILFNSSASPQFPFAVQEASKQPSFKQDGTLYSVSYHRDQSDELHLLLDRIKGFRNRRVLIDGQELPWDEVFHYLPCYRLRQKAYDPMEYCTGDSRQYPAVNPWGCIQALMPLSNDIEWLHYGQFDMDGTWIFDKKKIAHYLRVNTHQHRFCPAFDIKMMMRILDAFPETANPKIDRDWKYAEIFDRHIVANISAGSDSHGSRHYCGVRPASPEAVKNIYNKILDKLL